MIIKISSFLLVTICLSASQVSVHSTDAEFVLLSLSSQSDENTGAAQSGGSQSPTLISRRKTGAGMGDGTSEDLRDSRANAAKADHPQNPLKQSQNPNGEAIKIHRPSVNVSPGQPPATIELQNQVRPVRRTRGLPAAQRPPNNMRHHGSNSAHIGGASDPNADAGINGTRTKHKA